MKPLLSTLLFIMAACFVAQSPVTAANPATEDRVMITLTIGDRTIPAILYDNGPARDLTSKLPMTVTLNRGPIDYCGGIDPINYKESDVQSGYHNGDLAYWPPGHDFVIFTDKEETSSGVGNLVIIGKVEADIKEIRGLGDAITVTISLNK